MKNTYTSVKRMSGAMRIVHWVNVISVIAAVITGLYIAHPYYQSFIADPAVDKYVMAWNRWIHLMGAILLDITSVVVAYLYFFSRFEKAYKKLIPSVQNIREFGQVVINLLTLNRKKEFSSAHGDSFNAVYFAIMHLLLIFMLLSGLQMYVQGLGSGISSIGAWWPLMLHLATDWTLAVFGGNMGVRIAHHITMWWIIAWVMFHVYYQIWRTIFWKEGDIAIVIGGTKFVKKGN